MFLIVRDRAARRPAALFALCVRRRFGVKVVEFPDLGVTDYNAPLCARDLALTDAELDALWAQARLAIPGADVFVFEKLPEAIYGRPMPFARLSWLKPMRLRCWTLALPASRANYDRTALRARDRKEQRRKRRNLVERLGELRLVEAAGDEAAGVFAALKAMRAARFRRQGRRDLLQEPRFARFYEALALRGEPGFVSLVSVSAGEREIAALLGLRHADAYVLMHAFLRRRFRVAVARRGGDRPVDDASDRQRRRLLRFHHRRQIRTRNNSACANAACATAWTP